MAEEEAGFTFVDKRKVVADDGAGGVGDGQSFGTESTSQTSEAAAFDSDMASTSEDSAGDYMGEAPDVYMLLQYCVQRLAADAWQKMGLLADPQTGAVKIDLPQVKVAVDTVGDLIGRLESAPESAVSDAQKREFKNVLNNLRLNYVNQKSVIREGAEA